MRSKEVEEGIYKLQQAIDYDKEHRLVTIYDEKPLTRDLYQAVLNYISELEKENKKISDELIEEKQLNVKYLKIREEKENIIKKLSLETQKYFDMLMEVEYGRDAFPKQKIRDKIKELETYKFTSSKQCKKAYEDRIKDLKEIIGE